jgi:hypothetical protein
MNAKSDIARLDELIKRISQWKFTNELYQGIAGYVVGSAYCLKRALILGWDKQTSAEPLQDVCAALLNGEPEPPRRWLAGFYYNSAIWRLQAVLGSPSAINVRQSAAMRNDRNNLAHHLDEIVANGFQTTLQDALDCLDKIVVRLETQLDRRAGKL